MKKIILRADDLGYSRGVNYGIYDSIKEGMIRSIGIMTNMPDTRHGYELVRKLVPEKGLCLGLHTNICVGRPLCDPAQVPSICDENGNLAASKVYRSAREDFVVLEEVILEIEAQYQAFIELTGDKPHYFEGHAVTSRNFFKGLQIVAQRHGCDYLDMSNTGLVPFRGKHLTVCMDSMAPDYDPAASFKKAALAEYPDHTYPMFICHPGYLDAYISRTSSLLEPRTLEVEMVTSQEMKQWIRDNDVDIITYDDLKEG